MTEITGSTSDGFHTFDELYHHRTILFALLADMVPQGWAWKAREHEDGSMFDGFFIAGVKTPHGEATYHCRLEYWDLFRVNELDRAPAFDGHTPEDTLARLIRACYGYNPLEVTPRG